MTRVKIDRQKVLRLLDGFPVQVATEDGLLEFEAVIEQEWQPMRERDVPAHIIEHHQNAGLRHVPVGLWSNDIYEVFVYDAADEDADQAGIVWLSIKRYDRAAVRNWRHLQQIKNEVCGETREAVELFPSEHRLADNANQNHLWVFPEGFRLPFGFPSGMVLIREDEVEAWNRGGGPGRQEPMQPGLTVGRAMDEARTPEVTATIQNALKTNQR
jgi:hypothetical protein